MTWGLVAVAGATLVGGVIASNTGSKAATQAAQVQTQAADESSQVSRETLAQQEAQFEQTRQDTLDQQKQSRADTLSLYDQSRADTLGQYDQTRADTLGLYNQSRDDTLGLYKQTRDDTLGIYNTSRDDLAPYRTVGQNALLALSDQLGIARPAGTETTNTGNPQFRTDPGYEFAFDQGLKAVDARFPGMSKSGAKAEALTKYGQGVADQQYGNWLARLSGLASVGQTATGQGASLAASTSGTLASSNPSNILASSNPSNVLASSNPSSILASSNPSSALAASNPSNILAQLSANNSTAIGNFGTSQSNALQSAAAARASGYVGSANAVTGAISNGVNNLATLAGMYPANSNYYSDPEFVNVSPINAAFR